jgi:ABC-type transport system involved in multi-copper enzyme maturation permease subunit
VIWLSWRQLRIQAAAAAVGVAAAAIVLAVTGPHLADLTGNVFDQLTRGDRWLYGAGIVVLAVVPALLGAFWGAPLVSRELEVGTHRLVWTQSVTRRRWLATRLGLALLAAAVAMGVLALAVTWWAAPLDGAQSETRGSLPARLTPVAFAMRGIVPVAYGVFAVALGVAVGAVLRRSLAAMAVTLAVYVFVQIAMPAWVRPHLVPPVRETVTIGDATLDGISLRGDGPGAVTTISAHTADPGDWVLANQTLDPSGRVIDALPAWFGQCLPPPPSPANGPAEARGGRAALQTCLTRLADEGYRQQLVYQPASRFWALQWAETGVFIVLSGLLAWFSLWWVRRRLT